jgi:type VI secretion system protein ImpB
MAKEQSVAPLERVNITYRPATGGAGEQKELPLKLLFIGDFTGRADERPIEERKAIKIDADNFNKVLAEHKLQATIAIPNRIAGEGQMAVDLKFSSLGDFSPDAIVEKVPELKAMLEVRKALVALMGPLGNVAAFRKRIAEILANNESRERVARELGLPEKAGG